ncbi:unnamed protein product, partial [Ilex paraguariensis]
VKGGSFKLASGCWHRGWLNPLLMCYVEVQKIEAMLEPVALLAFCLLMCLHCRMNYFNGDFVVCSVKAEHWTDAYKKYNIHIVTEMVATGYLGEKSNNACKYVEH